jgi:uncharacterized protein YndB with AHSA1/START domain
LFVVQDHSTLDNAMSTDDRTLSLTRLIRAPRLLLWRAWTEPELLMQWFCPRPWQVVKAELDVRPGGGSFIVMRGPEGQEFPNLGVYLDVVPGRRLVFTDAFTEAWKPSERPFMVGEIRFDDADGATRYTATAHHWTLEAKAEHEKMGFHEGWGKATDQLEELVGTPV